MNIIIFVQCAVGSWFLADHSETCYEKFDLITHFHFIRSIVSWWFAISKIFRNFYHKKWYTWLSVGRCVGTRENGKKKVGFLIFKIGVFQIWRSDNLTVLRTITVEKLKLSVISKHPTPCLNRPLHEKKTTFFLPKK